MTRLSLSRRLWAIMLVASIGTAVAAPKDLGHGFLDLGVAAPISNHRGTVATVDGNGSNVLLVWLMDHRGGYELLLIDARTGKSEEFPIPFANVKEDSPYASILSSANRLYTHFGDYFVEFDPAKRSYTFSGKTTPQMGMAMTEDDKGVIWSITYPQSGVVSYDPATKKLRDYGHVYRQNWHQYPRYVAADDTGWIYFALGETASQIVALDPVSGKAAAMLPDNEREHGIAYVYRDLDGKVYGQALRKPGNPWYEFYTGAGRKIGSHEPVRAKTFITGSQALVHSVFPDGTRVRRCDLVERRLTVVDPRTSSARELPFHYSSEGALIASTAVAPDGTVCGGTMFPMRLFCYDPKQGTLVNRQAYDQFNTVASQGGSFFMGGYPGGFLLEWDPAKPWVATDRKRRDTNPLFLMQAKEAYRPTRLLPLADGRTIIMAGTPEYGATGGGLVFWDRQQGTPVVLKNAELIPDQSTLSLVELPGGKLLGGTTTAPGTGGEKKATQAEMYVLDAATRKIEWHAVVLPGVQDYTDMCVAPGGLVYGFADRKLFFVFDPARRAVVRQVDIETTLGLTASQQGPRVFVAGPGKQIHVLLLKGIARVDTATHELKLVAESPVTVACGGDHLDGRIYFSSGSHLYSYQLDRASTPTAAQRGLWPQPKAAP